MYKCAAFDLDGTLVNSLCDLGDSVNRVLEHHGLPTHSYESYKYFVGNGRAKLIERAMGAAAENVELLDAVTREYDELYALHCLDKTRPYPGLPEAIAKLKASGVKLTVLSNKPDEFVDKMLIALFPGLEFDLSWGKKAAYAPKPDPASLLAQLTEIGEDKDDCIYIGDSGVDVITARNSGVDFCGVLWGFRGESELRAEGAKICVNTAAELVQVILNGRK